MRTWLTIDGKYVDKQPDIFIIGYDINNNIITNNCIIHCLSEINEYKYHSFFNTSKNWTGINFYDDKKITVISKSNAFELIKKLNLLQNNFVYSEIKR